MTARNRLLTPSAAFSSLSGNLSSLYSVTLHHPLPSGTGDTSDSSSFPASLPCMLRFSFYLFFFSLYTLFLGEIFHSCGVNHHILAVGF